jgi:hypothetical protein
MFTRFWWKNLKEINRVEDLVVDGENNIKICIKETKVEDVGILIRFGAGTSVGLL